MSPVTKTVPFDLLYPEREGLGRTNSRISTMFHVGYYDLNMKACPKCGGFPVFEQYTEDIGEDGKRNVPAKAFVAICPRCEIRAKGHGSIEAVAKQWNRRRFVADTVMVQRKLEAPNTQQCRVLSSKVISQAMSDAVELIRRKHKLTEELKNPILGEFSRAARYEELKHVRSEISSLKRFFHSSPIMFDLEEEAALSAIRKALYPDLPLEERINIPLDLVRM